MLDTVKIVEVGPRDGLQNEKQPIAVDTKVALVERLVAAGVRHIEAASFVSPKWVPQMAGSAEVMQRVPRAAGVHYSALTPNLKGLEAAIAAGGVEVAVFGAASEAFSQRDRDGPRAPAQGARLRLVRAGLPLRGRGRA
jgi:hydroxymethylglutaryl-CoA lyase